MTFIEIILVLAWVAAVASYPQHSKKTGERNAKGAVVLGGAILVAALILAF